MKIKMKAELHKTDKLRKMEKPTILINELTKGKKKNYKCN